MKLNFSVKQMGKKRPFIDAKSIEITGEYNTQYSLEELLTAIVTQQVGEFNERRKEKSLFTFFQENEIAEETQTGKVRFGAIYNDNQANLEKAIETVYWAFKDGLIAVFVDNTQIEKLDENIVLQENTRITLVRLTFLVGSSW